MGRQSRQWPNQEQRLLDCRWGWVRALAAVTVTVTVTACLIGGQRQRERDMGSKYLVEGVAGLRRGRGLC